MSVSKFISLCECRKTEKMCYKLTVTEKKIVHKGEHNELFPIGLVGWLVSLYLLLLIYESTVTKNLF